MREVRATAPETAVGVTAGRSGSVATDLVDLRDIRTDMFHLVGGKALGLGLMAAAEFPVPDGFCITTSAYRRVLPIEEISAGFAQDPAEDECERLAERARRMILAEEMPADLRLAIADAYDRLSEGGRLAVAVRSSATTEDLPDASFAGQHDTYLDVRGVTEVIDAVRRCWASLWSDRAARYRSGNGVAHRDAEIAVVVQVMVDAAQAGVLFTVNPANERRDEMLVEAVRGLGESLVSGVARPEQYRVGPGAATVHGAGDLSRKDLRALWSVGRCLEAFFGSPQDIEWALDKVGTLWVTQSRPITTLFPVPEDARQQPRVYWSLNAYQGLTQPFTPMGAHMVRLRQMSFQPGLVASGVGRGIPDVDGWLYWDITDGAYSDSRRARIAHLVDAFTAPAGTALLERADSLRPDSGIDPLAFTPPRKSNENWANTAFALVFPGPRRARIMAVSERMVRAYVGPGADAAPDQRLAFVEEVMPKVARTELDLPREHGARRATRIAAGLLADVADETELNAVFRGVPGNPTTEMDLALWRLSVRIREEAKGGTLFDEQSPRQLADRYAKKTLPTAVQQAVSEFLRSYGFRVRAEIDLGVPRWSDDPEPVFAMLANYVRTTDPAQDAERRFIEAAAGADAKIRELTRRLPRRQFLRAWLARFMLRRSRALRGLREHGKVYLMRGFAQLREQLILIGESLVEQDRLACADDVMFLVPSELRSALAGEDLRVLVRERRMSYERECKRPRVPSLVLSDGRTLDAGRNRAIPSSGTQLRGLAAAFGMVTSTARVVHDPHAARLQPGEILVVASTDPGWTPLFLTAGALVSETGGLTSHGTTVAREYGIPAVVGVGDATRAIRTGDRVTVDGTSGTVTIHRD